MSIISPAQLIVESLSFVMDNATQFCSEYQIDLEDSDFQEAADLLMRLATNFQQSYVKDCENDLKNYYPDCTEIFDKQEDLTSSYELVSLLVEEGLSDYSYDDDTQDMDFNYKNTYTGPDVEEPIP